MACQVVGNCTETLARKSTGQKQLVLRDAISQYATRAIQTAVAILQSEGAANERANVTATTSIDERMESERENTDKEKYDAFILISETIECLESILSSLCELFEGGIKLTGMRYLCSGSL